MATATTLNEENKIHRLPATAEQIPLPEKFTYPFHYTPHPLCVLAAQEVQAYLGSRKDWQTEIGQGKMFGVLVVHDASGQLGFLAAFSGMLAGSNQQEYFVPPIYDLQAEGGFFKPEEQAISAINQRIAALETDKHYQELKENLQEAETLARLETGIAQMHLQQAKARRDHYRATHPREPDTPEMTRESQHQKAEFKRLKRRHAQTIVQHTDAIRQWEAQIECLKKERQARSSALQKKLFEQFHIRNARGESKDLYTLFHEAGRKEPPAGAGECAAPRLLQYAFVHQLEPLAMAEFWWGASPISEIRKQGYFYPACKGKCEPILHHMLEGLEVEDNPLLHAAPEGALPLEIVWEDPWIAVLNKPAGMLSVPGKTGQVSIAQWAQERFPGSHIVHRLDMATSGLLLIAKTLTVYRQLQEMFRQHAIQKRYAAWLEGIPAQPEGTIDLPLCLDPDNRPCQTVNFQHGKKAITRYKTINTTDNRTRVYFYPQTGRTHQLRVHAAHPLGLDCPIVGDELYGRKDKRLYLHAEALSFVHPVTGEKITIEKKADF